MNDPAFNRCGTDQHQTIRQRDRVRAIAEAENIVANHQRWLTDADKRTAIDGLTDAKRAEIYANSAEPEPPGVPMPRWCALTFKIAVVLFLFVAVTGLCVAIVQWRAQVAGESLKIDRSNQ